MPQAMRGQSNIVMMVTVVIGLFITGVLGLAFLAPMGNAAHAQDVNGATINNSNITGATQVTAYLTPTLGALILVVILLGGAALYRRG